MLAVYFIPRVGGKLMKVFAILVALSLPSSAGAQEMSPVFHNGSRFIFTRDRGKVEIRYETPKPNVPVSEGTILFSGKYDSRGYYAGTAYTFKRGCKPAPYHVVGKDAGPGIILVGAAPRRYTNSCDVVGETTSGPNAKLIFEFEREH